MAYDHNNIFAKILRGEIPSIKVFEDAHSLSFMDVMPQSDGHTLVIPKIEAENFFDIPPDALAGLIKTTQHVAKGVQKALQPAGMRIIQFNNAVAGQTVFHIHFHIVPCYENVPLKPHTRDMADMKMLGAQAEMIKAALAGI